MIIKPIRYAKSIGVNIDSKAILLGRTTWGTEPWLISIGPYTRVSKNVTFWNHDGGTSVAHGLGEKYSNAVKFGYISIGENCFIGANTTVLCNVSIGDNCVIGANSLVAKDIPSGEVWGGVPAKFISSTIDYAEKMITIAPDHDLELLKIHKKEETIRIAEEYRNYKRKQ